MKKRTFWLLILTEIFVIVLSMAEVFIGVFNMLFNYTVNIYQLLLFPLIGAFAIWQIYMTFKLYKLKK